LIDEALEVFRKIYDKEGEELVVSNVYFSKYKIRKNYRKT